MSILNGGFDECRGYLFPGPPISRLAIPQEAVPFVSYGKCVKLPPLNVKGCLPSVCIITVVIGDAIMKFLLRPTFVVLLLTLAAATAVRAQIPRTISFQGLLMNAQGQPISDGNHIVVLVIYDQANGGTVLFQETQTVQVLRGVFNTVIGGATAGGIPPSVTFDRPYFLGVAVDEGPELSPRTPMTSVPYAMHAAVADKVIGGSSGGGIQELTSPDGSIGITNTTGPVVQLQVQANGISTQHLQDESVTNSKLPANAVTAAKINTEGSASGMALISDGGATPVWGYPVASDLKLPYTKTQADAGSLLSITNSGSGRAAFFQADSTNSYTGVLEATTSGPGLVAKFSSTNTAAFASSAVQISSAGNSIALQVYGGGGGGWFLPGYPGAIYGTSGSGFAIQGSSTSGAGVFGGSSTGTGVYAQARGTGNALIAVSESGGTSTTTNGNIAIFKNTVNAGNVARISNTGKGFFNGGTQASGADVAESFDVEGARAGYEPGDVLVISTTRDRTVEKSSTPYSTAVVGVYATKPGMLLSDRNIDESHDDRVPMGVVGVIPTKVTSENGAIHRGDLLVTSSTPGHAMKASPITVNGITFYPSGVIIGKALENFEEEGSGLIEVMVNVK
jgi:hypothetical protein